MSIDRIRYLALRLENARNFFDNDKISKEEKERYKGMLDELLDDIDQEMEILTGEDKEYGILLLTRIYGGQEI